MKLIVLYKQYVMRKENIFPWSWKVPEVGKIGLSLFDLKKDEGETTNVAAEHPEIVDRLKKFAEHIRKDLGDSSRQQPGPGIRKLGITQPPTPARQRRQK